MFRAFKARFLNSTALSNVSNLATARRPRPYNGTTTIELINPSNSARLSLGERGIIASNPMKIQGTSVEIISSQIDSLELRRMVLFWDKVAWPENNGIHIASGPEIDFLIKAGIVFRPRYAVNGDVATAMALAASDAYTSLEKTAPGQWSLSAAYSQILLKSQDFEKGRGVLTRLSGAIPVPDRDVPLENILEFRNKRKDEVDQLNQILDEFYQRWVNSEDRDHSFASAITELDANCAAVIRTTKEAGLKTVLTSWDVAVSFSLADVAKATGVFLAGKEMSLPTTSALLMGAAGLVSFSRSIGKKDPAIDLAPYKFVASLDRELW